MLRASEGRLGGVRAAGELGGRAARKRVPRRRPGGSSALVSTLPPWREASDIWDQPCLSLLLGLSRLLFPLAGSLRPSLISVGPA